MPLVRVLVDRVDPVDLLRLFDRVHISNVHHNSLVIAAHENAFEGLVRAGVDLLMRHEGRHIDEVAREPAERFFVLPRPRQ